MCRSAEGVKPEDIDDGPRDPPPHPPYQADPQLPGLVPKDSLHPAALASAARGYGLGVAWTAHLVPFHTSAKVLLPELV
jgi:hypothetical protein